MLDAVGEESTVGEVGDRVVEGLMGELVLEGLALADVAAVEDDAADRLVVEKVGVANFEAKPALVGVLERAFERVRVGAHLARVVHDPLEPRAVGLGEEAVEARALDLVGRVAEHSLDRGALIGDDAVGVEDRDQVARVRDERAEASLALLPVEILDERRGLERERDLRRERVERASISLRKGDVRLEDECAPNLVADRQRQEEKRHRLFDVAALYRDARPATSPPESSDAGRSSRATIRPRPRTIV